MPKRSCKRLPLSEKVKVLHFLRKKISYAAAAEVYGKNQSSVREIVKEKEICASFAVTLQTTKVTVTVRTAHSV